VAGEQTVLADRLANSAGEGMILADKDPISADKKGFP
jgi:hypothetical protein